MTFQIIDNMQAPEAPARTRQPGAFTLTLNSLEIGQGFEYTSAGTTKGQYPKISPKKFGGKRFRVWLVSEGENGEPNTFAVKRENDRAVKDAAPGVNTVENDNDE